MNLNVVIKYFDDCKAKGWEPSWEGLRDYRAAYHLPAGEVRVQVYNYESGVFRKQWIEHVTREEYDRMTRKQLHRVFILRPDDWFGETLPPRIVERV